MALFADVVLAGSAVLAGGVAYLAYRNRPRAGSLWLAGMMCSVALWGVSHLAAHHAAGALGLALEKLTFTALVPIAFLWLAFVLSYTDRREFLTRRAITALFAWPVAVTILSWIPEGTGIAAWSAIEAEQGAVFWGHVLLSYGLLAAGTVLLLRHLAATSALFRRQGLAILGGIGFAWAGSVVSVFELFGDVHLHALPGGFVLMGVCFLWAVVGTGVTRITPIAHRSIVHGLEAGVIAIDAAGNVASANPASAELLGLSEEATPVGEPLAEVLDGQPDLRDWVETVDVSAGNHAETFQVDDAVIECELSPLRDDRGQYIGAVLLMYDVTERRRRREQLARQNEQLEQFGSVLSHDLRNPLNVAKGHLELAREGGDGDHLATVGDALDRMEALVEDLRALTRGGQPIEETEEVRLSALVDRSWEMVHAPEADIAVEDDLAFEADPDRCVQLLENLFRNAVEHGSTSNRASPDDAGEHGSTDGETGAEEAGANGGSTVSIRVGAIGGEGFYVADDGPGIPEDDRVAVFESGYTTAAEGTGLGLSIVSEVAEAHGWSVRVVESERGGARIEVTGV